MPAFGESARRAAASIESPDEMQQTAGDPYTPWYEQLDNNGLVNTGRLASMQADVARLADERSSRVPSASPNRATGYEVLVEPDSPQAAAAEHSPSREMALSPSRRRWFDVVLIPEAGSRKESWDLIVLVFILYSAMSVPFRIGFSADATVRRMRANGKHESAGACTHACRCHVMAVSPVDFPRACTRLHDLNAPISSPPVSPSCIPPPSGPPFRTDVSFEFETCVHRAPCGCLR